MGLKRFIKKVKNKKGLRIALEILLSSTSIILFFSIIILLFILLISNYRVILADFGIKVEDDCKFQNLRLSCNFLNLSGEDFEVKLEKINGDLQIKNLIEGKHLIDLNVEKGNILYINDPKAPPSEKIKGIFEAYIISNYIRLNLKEGRLEVKNIEEDTDLYAEGIHIHNRKNSLDFGKPAITIKQGEKTFKLSTHQSKVSINPSSIELEELSFIYDNLRLSIKDSSIHERKKMTLAGSLEIFGDVSFEGLSLNQATLSYKAYLIPDRKVYLNVKGNGKRLVYSKAEIKSEDVEVDIKLDGQSFSEFYSEGRAFLWKNRVYRGDLNAINIGYKLYKKQNKLSIEGSVSSQLLDFNFEFRDDKIRVETKEASLSKLIPFVSDSIKDISGSIKLTAEYSMESGQLTSQTDIRNLSFLDFKNLNGSLSLAYQMDKDSVNLKSQLRNGKTTLSIGGDIYELSTSPNLSLEVKANGFRLHTLQMLRELKIDGDVDFKATVKGRIQEPSVLATGQAHSFSFEDVQLKGIDFSLNYLKDRLDIRADNLEKTLSAEVSVIPNQEKTNLRFVAKNFNPAPVIGYLRRQTEIFNIINPISLNGNVSIDINGDDLKIWLDIPQSKFTFKTSTPLNATVFGHIQDHKLDLKVSASGDNFMIEGITFKNVEIKSDIKNSALKYSLKTTLLRQDATLDITSSGKYDISEETLDMLLTGDGRITLTDRQENISINLKTSGKVNNLKGDGILKLDKTSLPFSIDSSSQDRRFWYLNVITNSLNYPFNGTKITFDKVSGKFVFDVEKPESFNGSITISNLNIIQRIYELVKLKETTLIITKDSLSVRPTTFSGILSGKVQSLDYSFKDGYTKVVVDGTLDRKYVSEFLQFINLDGELKFLFSYSGNLENLPYKYNLRFYGENLRVRTTYLQTVLGLKTFNIETKDNLLLNMYGTIKSSTGEGFLKISGVSETDLESAKVEISSKNLPVKFENRFSGTIDSNTRIESKGKDISISTDTKLTGRVRIEPDMLEKNGREEERPEILRKTKLNLKVSTSSPILFEGSWGRAYADLDLDITGTVEKPLINGKVKVGYGKINLMKNVYNIDFINVNITNNDIYLNGRLSILVSGVNIFVNVSGPGNNLRYDFFSTPPKSREEILSILLLKKSPEQLMTTGIFGVIGKIGEMLIPFKVEEEEKGLFGTGVNVNIIPSYSPVQGIVLSVYLQKYLTRRVYIGLSRPLSQYQLTNYVGWYEGGFRLTERTSFVIKSFENKSRSAEITFTLPFDF